MDISIELKDWECVLEDKKEMEGCFLDLLLRHIVFWAAPNVREQYHVAHNWMSQEMQLFLDGRNKGWDDLVSWVARSVRSKTMTENTLIVPYNDRGHWSVFIVEEDWTYHSDTLSELHEGPTARNFLYLVHMGWALARGVEVNSAAWREWQERQPIRLNVPLQADLWECGYMASLGFWQYLQSRGSSRFADRERVTTGAYRIWDGRKAYRWFMQALYLELVAPLPFHEVPNFSGRAPGCMIDDEDTVIVEGATTGSKKPRAVGIAATVKTRRLEDFNVLYTPKHTELPLGAEKPKPSKPKVNKLKATKRRMEGADKPSRSRPPKKAPT